MNVVNKNENIINAGYWALSEIAKINSQQENQFVLITKINSLQYSKNHQSAKIDSRKVWCHTVNAYPVLSHKLRVVPHFRSREEKRDVKEVEKRTTDKAKS